MLSFLIVASRCAQPEPCAPSFSTPTTLPELQSPLRSLWEPDAASESCPIYVLRCAPRKVAPAARPHSLTASCAESFSQAHRMRHARGGRGGALRTRASTPRFCPGEGSCKRSFFLSFSVRVCPRARLLTPLLGLFRRRTGSRRGVSTSGYRGG